MVSSYPDVLKKFAVGISSVKQQQAYVVLEK